MRLLICAGGTGGGIYPALAVVSELGRRGVPAEMMLWIGARGEIEEELVPRAGLRLETIAGGAIVGVPPHRMIMNAARLAWSLGATTRLVRQFRPDALFITGGYVAVPVALSAWAQRVPIAAFVPDVEPGSALRLVMPLARRVACTTDGSRAYVPDAKRVVTGYPVRPVLRAALGISRAEALGRFDLRPGPPTVLVFGGSRGAWSINQALMAALPTLLTRAQIIHISGTLTWPQVAANLESLTDAELLRYRAYPYLHDRMGAAFRAADLVVARAGASMLGEMPAFGLPAVLVPYPHAWRYQKVNADYLAQRGAAVTLPDAELARQLAPTVLGLLADKGRLAAMAAAAVALDAPDATGRLADVVWELGQRAMVRSGQSQEDTA